MRSVPRSSWYRKMGTCLIRVQVGKGFRFDNGSGLGGVQVWEEDSCFYMQRSHARLWCLNLTSTYLTLRLSKEEREKRDPAGGRTAHLIYPDDRRLTLLQPSRLLASSGHVRLLHKLPLALLSSHCRLPPHTASRRLPPPSTAFHLLPPVVVPMSCNMGAELWQFVSIDFSEQLQELLVRFRNASQYFILC